MFKYDYNSTTGQYAKDTTFVIKPTGTIVFNANFGSSLSCDASGNMLIVGSEKFWKDGSYTGNVHAFKKSSSGSWSLLNDFYSDIKSNISTSIFSLETPRISIFKKYRFII